MRPGYISPSRQAFVYYLRTGRQVEVEQKYNMHHDPANGQFTFAVGGTSRAAKLGPSTSATNGAGRSRIGRSSADDERLRPNSLSNPRNHTIYVVKRGDSLAKIAALRNGLKPFGLAVLNGITRSDQLRAGQRLMLPNQSALEAGRDAKNKFLRNELYRSLHGGEFPPNPANPPDFFDPENWTAISSNGYLFHRDIGLRTRRVQGALRLNPAQTRSPTAQRNAGGFDRLPKDQGGHFIGRRFNGPRQAFNHFAQDGNFNNGLYRTLENGWERAVKQGNKVTVDILPTYGRYSQRPSSIDVVYFVGGKRYFQHFPNAAKGK